MLDTLFADIQKLVCTCDYGALEDFIVHDKIVLGVRCDATCTRKKLLQKCNLDLKCVISICKACEAESRQMREMLKSIKADVHEYTCAG